jgi:hypothetical protein
MEQISDQNLFLDFDVNTQLQTSESGEFQTSFLIIIPGTSPQSGSIKALFGNLI